MDGPITPRQVQRRMTRLLNFEDGLWDILLGLVFLELSVYPITRGLLGPTWNLGLYLAVLVVLVVGMTLVRRAVATPRLGFARPRWTPLKGAITALLIATVLGTFALVLLTLRNPGWISSFLPGGAGPLTVDLAVVLVEVVVFSVMGLVFRVVRFFFYGWLIGLGNLASTALTLQSGIAFNAPLAVASLIILLTGVVLLTRFLLTYPAGEVESAP
jgi:hypothetical protein